VEILMLFWINFFLFLVPVLVLFTKADMLDAETIECLVNSGMSLEEAAIKAPEESAIKFQNSFGNQLYKKKYPPTGHLYLRGNKKLSIILRQQIDCIY
jgi:hypothetical protein